MDKEKATIDRYYGFICDLKTAIKTKENVSLKNVIKRNRVSTNVGKPILGIGLFELLNGHWKGKGMVYEKLKVSREPQPIDARKLLNLQRKITVEYNKKRKSKEGKTNMQISYEAIQRLNSQEKRNILKWCFDIEELKDEIINRATIEDLKDILKNRDIEGTLNLKINL